MGKRIQGVKGTRDLLPPETELWAAVERTARQVFSWYGYQEIRTPLLENTELFVRTVGATTDIVGKEMYSFADRKGRSLSLRPESTASVARAIVQHGMQHQPLPLKLFYIGPHFRYERPQKGRYRQFHQIGAELVGDPGPYSDAEVILMLVRFLSALDFEDLVVQLNTVGDESSRSAFRNGLVEFLEPLSSSLSGDSRRRLATNPLRILDSKDPGDREVLEAAPRLVDFLTEESREHFRAVREVLDRQKIRYRVEPRLVRGLDYYTKTVFEIVSEALGAQDAIVGGGRYDGLVEELGGPPLPGIGFAIGEDRLVEVIPEKFTRGTEAVEPVVVVSVAPVSALAALEAAEALRQQGVATVAELSGRSIKAALKRAHKAAVRWVVLIGEEELEQDRVTVRDLNEGHQESVARAELSSYVKGEK
jgi:histidyl-tRNA synthetase